MDKINIPSSTSIEIELSPNKPLFILGSNGSGKSTLMHLLSKQFGEKCKWITAHRQVWLTSNQLEITPATKKQQEIQINNLDKQDASKYSDPQGAQRTQITLFDLLDSENSADRQLAKLVRSGKAEEADEIAKKQPSPLNIVNQLLLAANLKITIELDESNSFIAQKLQSEPYSIAMLSDGERNALLIIANVLTASTGSKILLDEPERHLHRAIIAPLLTALIEQRKDCIFIISTHEPALPIEQNNASALLLRNFNVTNSQWDADYIDSFDSTDEELNRNLIGARKIVLFVEGKCNSLDKSLYEILYPELTIISSGNCTAVEKNVKGLRAANDKHWIKAVGLVDRDFRTDQNIETLQNEGIFALDCYSVESIYYHSKVLKEVINQDSQVRGGKSSTKFNNAKSTFLKEVENAISDLAARKAENEIRKNIIKQIPSHKELSKKESTNFTFNDTNIFDREKQRLTQLVANKKYDEIIQKYPVRQSNALSNLVKKAGFENRNIYEKTARQVILNNKKLQNIIRSTLKPLTNEINILTDKKDHPPQTTKFSPETVISAISPL